MTDRFERFDAGLPAFQAHLATPWGRLQRTLCHANLARHLPAEVGPLQVLDVGGGNGPDALHLIVSDHQVTLIDPSSAMLREAERIATAEGMAERLQTLQADLAAIPLLFPERSFDMVLCHNVLPYVDDLPAALEAITVALRPGGLLSIMCVNRYSEAMRWALMQLDLPVALAALEKTSTTSGVFDTSIRLDTAEEMIGALEALDYTVIGRYGVRSVCDYIADNAIKEDPESYEQLVELELALSDRFPYFHLARFFHLIATKRQIAGIR